MNKIQLLVDDATVFLQVPPAIPPNPATVNQFVDRLLTPPTPANLAAYTALINSLVVGGVWPKLDALYVFAAADPASSFIDLIAGNPQAKANIAGATFAQTFTPYVGWNGCSSPDVADISLGMAPSACAKLTQNDASAFGWIVGTAAEDCNLIRCAGNGIRLYAKATATGLCAWTINGSSDASVLNTADSSGFWLMNRTAANFASLYRNGVLLQTTSNNSAPPSSANLTCEQTINKAAIVGWGQSLNADDMAILKNACQVYLTTVGAI